ncbi:MAG: ATP-binding protein [Pirellulales bacterium]|nr:ATP-binding protein [Pirellulales bacterium]
MFNTNSKVLELLSWHGHDAGGISVPFQSAGSPLGSRVTTPLVLRLRELARALANREDNAPRWIFLVGGPGNGKSETVQDFLESLDDALAMEGSLISILREKFRPTPIVRRSVEVLPADCTRNAESFASAIGRLIVVQDATASDDAFGDAAQRLAFDLTELVTSGESPRPVVVVCANRGLLARTVNVASVEYGPNYEVTQLLENILRASSLGIDALTTERKSCWPLDSDCLAACWPMDLESLLAADSGTDPFGSMIQLAVSESEWEISGRCSDCDAQSICPFRQNAQWLRTSRHVTGLRTILRRGELATGQRWNLRGLFSLAAELCVGEWSDFGESDHPCHWVASLAEQLNGDNLRQKAIAVLGLIRRLYPQAMFPDCVVTDLADYCRQDRNITWNGEVLSQAFASALATTAVSHATQIRGDLATEYAILDPARSTPQDASDLLNECELAFSQSVRLGSSYAQGHELSALEIALLGILAEAEDEWSMQSRNVRQVSLIWSLLRKFASVVVKRSIAVRSGHHAEEEYLTKYESGLRDQQQLNFVRQALIPMLGQEAFQFNLVESYGQPTSDDAPLLSLQCGPPGVPVFKAPDASEERPAHDMPWFEIRDIGYPIPITYEFFRALMLRQSGCANSSLPASVRAAIDRVRHLYAGEVCRDGQKFADGTARINVMDRQVSITHDGGGPQLL